MKQLQQDDMAVTAGAAEQTGRYPVSAGERIRRLSKEMA